MLASVESGLLLGLGMRVGVVYSQTGIREDPRAVRKYAQVSEFLGHNHIPA